ncbi:ECF transporter S component [Cytobacillus spongiae]|jgi:uncharacterized membrane protein|uniref:ECF transporter S component n=1 Tax=Cytobacillus spongiae TaxID=2901381 RepID=UPI001F24D8E4|nr:ECF transporter S component [Cytobacillus spongiae]UII56192.1 ECF transporter S component [Cytobacillus spongiae]
MKAKKLSYIALFIALSVVGASLKIPAIVGSVALDAFPALLASALLGGSLGGVVGAMGHLLSALLAGMPLGPMHAVIAFEMFALVWLFHYYYHRGQKLLSILVFVIGNTLLAPLPFLFLMGIGFYLAIVPSLFIGSVLNIFVAVVLIPRLSLLQSRLEKNGEVKL